MQNEYGLDPNRAFSQFFKDPNWKLKAGLGAVLNASTLCAIMSGSIVLPLVPVAFVILAAVQGYTLRVIRSEITFQEGSSESPYLLPKWNDWLDLLISGLTWLAIICGQWMLFISIATVAMLVGQHFGALNAQSTTFKPWFLATATALSFAAFMTSFLFPLLMVNFAEQEKVTAALSFDEVFRRLSKRPLEFVAVWLLNVGLFWLGIIVPVLSVFGIFFIPLMQFIIGTVNAVMLAQVWRSAKPT